MVSRKKITDYPFQQNEERKFVDDPIKFMN